MTVGAGLRTVGPGSVPLSAGHRTGRGARGGTAVVEEPALTFAGLLRQLRAEARLTQEELAAAAELSPRAVSDLERGINRTARKETAVLLAGAPGPGGPGPAVFLASRPGPGPPPGGEG